MFNQPKSKQKLVHHNRLKRFFGKCFKTTDDAVIEEQVKPKKNLVKSKGKTKVVKAKTNKKRSKQVNTTDHSDKGQASNKAPDNTNKVLVNPSESVQESTDEEDVSFKPNHYLQAKLKGSENQPSGSQYQPRRSKRQTKPVDRLKF